jgi:hypothetical protein
MEAVGHLPSQRRPGLGSFGIGLRTVPDDGLHTGMSLEPFREDCRLPPFQEIDPLMGDKIDQEGGVGTTATQGEIIDSEHRGRWSVGL